MFGVSFWPCLIFKMKLIPTNLQTGWREVKNGA